MCKYSPVVVVSLYRNGMPHFVRWTQTVTVRLTEWSWETLLVPGPPGLNPV